MFFLAIMKNKFFLKVVEEIKKIKNMPTWAQIYKIQRPSKIQNTKNTNPNPTLNL